MKTQNTILLSPFILRGEKRIGLTFLYNSQLIELAKKIPGYRYSVTHKVFHYPHSKEVLLKIREIFAGIAFLQEKEVSFPGL